MVVKVWLTTDKAVATAWLRSVISTLTHHGGYTIYDGVPYVVVTYLPATRVVQVLRRWAPRPYLRRNNVAVTWSVIGKDEVHVTIADREGDHAC